MTRHLAILCLALCVGCAYGELSAQERVAKRVAEKYHAPVEESLPRGCNIITIRGCEYLQTPVYGGYALTHMANCTNHAPTVITNTVYVTNECKHDAWARSKIDVRDSMYRGPIPNDWVMGTNGYMVPPQSPDAWPTNRCFIGGGVPNNVNVEAQ